MEIYSINNRKIRTNLVGAGLVGATAGYAAKYAFPLTKYEKVDTFTKSVLQSIEDVVRNTKKREFESIMEGVKLGSEEINETVLNIFENNKADILTSNFEKLQENLNGLKEETKEGVMELAERITKSGEVAKEVAKKAIEVSGKSKRPTFYFLATGATIALSIVTLAQSMILNAHRENVEPYEYIV